MSEIEPRKQTVGEVAAKGAGLSGQGKDRLRDHNEPKGWRPNRGDYEQVEVSVYATDLRSNPLNYPSMAEASEQIMMIEANARADAIRRLDQDGVTVNERGIRPAWQLVVHGYGFKMPKGFIHPEAPPDVVAEGHERWKRSVEMASDSMTRVIFCQVWRRRRGLPTPDPRANEIETRPIALESPSSKGGY